MLTYVLSHLREQLGLPSVLLLFLQLAVAVAAIGGVWPALVAAISGFLLVNWYFTPPLYTLTISEGENILALVVFLAVAMIVSTFVALASRRQAEGARARAEAEALAHQLRLGSLDGCAHPRPRGSAVRHEGGWQVEAASGDRSRTAPRRARRPSSSTASTCSR